MMIGGDLVLAGLTELADDIMVHDGRGTVTNEGAWSATPRPSANFDQGESGADRARRRRGRADGALRRTPRRRPALRHCR